MISEERAAEIYGQGWAYYTCENHPPEYGPWRHQGAELVEWMKGFCAAIADYDPELKPYQRHPTLQLALLDSVIIGDKLNDCLKAAEVALDGEEWCRWPSVPVRGLGPSDKAGPVFYDLLEAADDEVG